eukprot:PhM_4_TR15669/c3_g2_i1/m.3268
MNHTHECGEEHASDAAEQLKARGGQHNDVDANDNDDNGNGPIDDGFDSQIKDRTCPKFGRTGCCLLGGAVGTLVGGAAGAYAGMVATKHVVHQQLLSILGPKLAAVFTL